MNLLKPKYALNKEVFTLCAYFIKKFLKIRLKSKKCQRRIVNSTMENSKIITVS
jgi:hypothetical protein